MAQRFLFGLGGGGAGSVVQGTRGDRDPENFIMVMLTGVSSVGSTSQAKTLAITTIDVTELDLGSWVGIKWTKNLERKYGIGTGNGGATIRDLYDRETVDWYTVTTDSLADFLFFEYSDTE